MSELTVGEVISDGLQKEDKKGTEPGETRTLLGSVPRTVQRDRRIDGVVLQRSEELRVR